MGLALSLANESKLCREIRRGGGDLDKISELLEGADLDKALYVAIEKFWFQNNEETSVKICEFLLKNGANPDAKGKIFDSPLENALLSSNRKVVELLLNWTKKTEKIQKFASDVAEALDDPENLNCAEFLKNWNKMCFLKVYKQTFAKNHKKNLLTENIKI